jgi:type II secretory pathway pseudopilin PulG
MGKKIRGRPGGFALAAALMVMLVVAILVTGVLTMALSASRLAGSRQDYVQALYGAEGGMNAVISSWRTDGLPDGSTPNSVDGALSNGNTEGSYHVTWTWPPDASGVVTLTGTGTTNPNFWSGSLFRLNRTVSVELDTDGDWAWNHVYYADEDQTDYWAQYDPDWYAYVSGNDSTINDAIQPGNEAHAPGAGGKLPSPIWKFWRDWAARQDTEQGLYMAPVKPSYNVQVAGGALPYTGISATSTPVLPKPGGGLRHVYWYGAGVTDDPADHPAGADGDHQDYVDGNLTPYNPDLYGYMNPTYYWCQAGNKPFTVEFDKWDSDGDGKADDYNIDGNFFVYGDVVIKQKVNVRGSIIATGSITTQAQAAVTASLIVSDGTCEGRVFAPALIAGNNVTTRDSSVDATKDAPADVRIRGVIWAGEAYENYATSFGGCVVSPNIRFGGTGTFEAIYGTNFDDGCPPYEPGAVPPPWFREPDRGEMQPTPRSWREH